MLSRIQAPRPGRITRLIFVPSLGLTPRSGPIISGKLVGPGFQIPCVVGRSGTAWQKIEGDGKTPRGRFRIVSGFWRADRNRRPNSQIPLRPTRLVDGWCDAKESGPYNRLISLPSPMGHERLWRADNLYDFVLVLDYNYTRRSRARGSAIFFHIWQSPTKPTEGCVAIDFKQMLKILPRLSAGATLAIC